MVPKAVRHLWDNKTEFTLGKTATEAYRVWAERLGSESLAINNISDLFDRYLIEHVTTLSPGSRESAELAIRRLRPVFGAMSVHQIQPVHAYKYADKVTQKHGFTSAKHDVAVLRHSLTKAVQWGALARNPLIGQVRLVAPAGVGVRDRLVEDWEIAECLAIKSNFRGVKLCQPYIKFKLMTGLRRKDILMLKLSDLKSDGIHVTPSKTQKSSGRRLIIEWDADGHLRSVVDEILNTIKPKRIGNAFLFITRGGKGYYNETTGKANGFDSMWQRFMDKVLAETRVSDRFQERDLRAKTGSDSDTLVEASERLGHANTATTQRVYRRKPVRVQPLIRK